MTPERWQRMENLFHSALELADGERTAYLRQACGDDEELRHELERMLAEHAGACFTETWAAAAAQRVLEQRGALKPGERLGPYEIDAHVASGGMGMVYRAHDTRLDRMVAIKILRPASADEEMRARIEREAQAIAKLQHPNICALYDVGRENGRDFLVMEFLEGETMDERLRRGRLSFALTLQYGIEIAGALEQAHRRNITHRDLKPANVMITKSGVKLLDFGLASWSKVSEPAGAAHVETALTLTVPGTVMGTLPYMAPEQTRGENADARTDIFAFGLLMYEMLAAHQAFDQPGRETLVHAIQNTQPVALCTLRPEIPPALERAISLCLPKDPDERWQNAGDLKRELAWIAAGGAGGGGRQVSRRRMAVFAGTGVIGAIAAGWAGYRIHTPPASKPFTYYLAPPAGADYAEGGLALSPEGDRIAFVAKNVDGASALWIRALDEPTARLILGTEGAQYPFWSPDGRYIAFFADKQLRKIDAGGGPVQMIAEAPVPYGGAWGGDDTILFVPDRLGGVQRVAASGGQAVPAALVDKSRGDSGHGFPSFLPDGKHFLFSAFSTRHPPTLHMGSLDSKEVKDLGGALRARFAGGKLYRLYSGLKAQPFDPRRLRFTGEPIAVGQPDSPAFFDVTANGTIAYRLAAAAGPSELSWLNRSGEVLSTTFSPDRYTGVALSPDGRTAAVVIDEPGGPHIWVYGSSGQRRSLSVNSAFPVWSPDGKRIAYTALNKGQIVMRPVDNGGSEEALVTAPTELAPQSWSRDGKYLGYTRHEQPSNKYALWIVPVSGNRQPSVFLKTQDSNSQGVFSPDGQWIAYWSSEAGRPEIFIVRFPDGGGKRRVSANGGLTPQWRSDGKELFYTDLANRLMAVSVNTHGPGIETGEPQVLFPLRQTPWGLPCAPTDGRRFLAIRPVKMGDPQPIVVRVPGNSG